jgi:hypothetical protein
MPINDKEADTGVMQFLSYMDKLNVAAMTMYGFMGQDGKPILRLKSNQPEGPTQGILRILSGTDEKSVEVGAQAAARFMGQSWEDLDEDDQERCRLIAATVLEAARGRLVDTVQISGNPDDGKKPASKIVAPGA